MYKACILYKKRIVTIVTIFTLLLIKRFQVLLLSHTIPLVINHEMPSVPQAKFQVVAIINMEFTEDELRGYVGQATGLDSHTTMAEILTVMRECLIENASLRYDAKFSYSVCDQKIYTPENGIYGKEELARFNMDWSGTTEEFIGQVEAENEE